MGDRNGTVDMYCETGAEMCGFTRCSDELKIMYKNISLTHEIQDKSRTSCG